MRSQGMTSEPSNSVRLAREEFPVLESRVYLNTAAVALLQQLEGCGAPDGRGSSLLKDA